MRHPHAHAHLGLSWSDLGHQMLRHPLQSGVATTATGATMLLAGTIFHEPNSTEAGMLLLGMGAAKSVAFSHRERHPDCGLHCVPVPVRVHPRHQNIPH